MRRVFVLGAGFSAPAGLPLTRDLLELVLREQESLSNWPDRRSHLHRAYDDYRRYLTDTTGRSERVDIEQFVEWLDYRHLFWMLSSDTWSEEGNRDQLQLRWALGRVLLRRSPAEPHPLHRAFARRLQPGDVVLTFNYDLLLEAAMDAESVPYRRFPDHLHASGLAKGTTDHEANGREVLLLKLHGSIDWVSSENYGSQLRQFRDQPDVVAHLRRTDALFGSEAALRTRRLVPLAQRGDGLNHVHVVDEVRALYSDAMHAYARAPLILAPSRAKQFYGTALRGLWDTAMSPGYNWGGLSMIGFSLGGDDNYAKQVLWQLVQGYVQAIDDETVRFNNLDRIQVVDFRTDEAGRRSLREAYRFLPRKHSDFHFGGLNDQTLEMLFPATPYRVSRMNELVATPAPAPAPAPAPEPTPEGDNEACATPPPD